jgi:hypothetical protein
MWSSRLELDTAENRPEIPGQLRRMVQKNEEVIAKMKKTHMVNIM